MSRFFEKGQTITSRTGQSIGTVVTGNEQPCQMESCRGVRAVVKWDNGERSVPCSKGLAPGENTTFKLL